MAVELRTLRVSAEMDASGYARGAAQKVAADQQMIAGARSVNVALVETEQKVSQAADPVARLSRQFVTGYAEAARFETGMRSLNRAIEQGRIDAMQAELVYQGMVNKLGMVANATDITRQGFTQLGAVVDTVNARMARTPMPGMDVPANDNEAAFRRRGLIYQGFDIGTSLAGGINPAMVAIQQGPQIAQMYMGQGGVNAALRDAGSLALTLGRNLGPIAAIAAAGALAIQDMQEEIERATGKGVTFGETFSAAIKVIAGDMKDLLQPAIDAIGPPLLYAFDKLKSAAVDLVEWTINAFRAAAADIGFIWQQFPNIVGAAVTGSMNAVVSATMSTIETVSDYVDSWIETVNAALAKLNEYTGQDWAIPPIGFNAGNFQIPNTYYDDLQRANEEHRRRVEEILGSNPLRDYFGSVRDRVAAGIGGDAGAGGGVDPWMNLRQVNGRPSPALKDTQEFTDLSGDIKGFFSDFRQGLMEGKDIGEAFANAILNAFNKFMDRQIDAIFERIANSIAGAILGPGGHGNVASVAFGASGDAWAGMREAANSNFSAPVIPVTRAPLPDIGAGYGEDLVTNAVQLARNIGSSPRDVLALMSFESGLRPNIWGGAGGRHYGLIQAGGPERAQYGISPGGSLASQFGGIEAFFKDRGFKPGMGMMDLYSTVNAGRPGLYGASDAANGGTWGTVADKVNFQMEGHFKRADDMLARFSGATEGATQNLGMFGNSLSQLASSFVSGVSGGSGWGMSNLFGLDLSNLGAGFTPGLGGGFAGLIGYANGTEGAPAGWAWVGESGPELMRMRGGETIRSHAASMAMSRGGGPVEVHVVSRFDADGGFDTRVEKVVEKRTPRIARQQAAGVVGENNYRMGKGGSVRQSQSYNHLHHGTRYG